MTDTGVEWICRMLRENTALKHLDLSWYVHIIIIVWVEPCLYVKKNYYCSNKLSRDGARHLSVLLRVNTPLSQLNISNNRIEDEGLVHISQALATENTNLQR